jgi:hypothetical protein
LCHVPDARYVVTELMTHLENMWWGTQHTAL